MKWDSNDLRNALAAEYVLGTLRGRARQRFARQLDKDRSLGEVVARWEAFLTPLAERVKPVEPPSRVWEQIEKRISRKSAAQSAGSWWESIAFWRNWGLAASGFAVVMLVAMFMLRTETPVQPTMMAVLSTPENVPRMIVEVNNGHKDELLVKVVKPWASLPQNDLELWVIPKDGAPRSLGVVNYKESSRIKMAGLSTKLADGTAFAISREPKGGSPTGAPTGPVLCSGAIVRA
jgi:anti-sigma-K factor RskA